MSAFTHINRSTMSTFYRWLILLSLFAILSNVFAAVDVYQFDTESQRQRYHILVDELRCPKCQNQNLAGSNSQIAVDLRRELHRLLIEGKTDREIKAFMVARYGDFVLYNPPLKVSTLVLWLLPVVLVIVGSVVLVTIVRQRRQMAIANRDLSGDDLTQLNRLLEEEQDQNTGKPHS